MIDELVQRVRGRLRERPRVLIGIAGAPGAGKSTLAEALVDAIDPRRTESAWIPMDGFHLADVELDRLGRRGAKGAIDTFDAWGYLALLQRVRRETSHVVYAPSFERELEQPIAGAIPVLPSARLVVTEGNYLLDESEPWGEVRAALDEVWYLEVDDDARRRRLVERHMRFGKPPEAAVAWVLDVDEPNARRVAAGRHRAHLVVSAAGGSPPAG